MLVRHEKIDSTQYYVARAGDSGNKDYASFRLNGSDNKFRGYILDDDVSSNYRANVFSNTSVSVNTWYHVVFTKDWDGNGSKLRMYVNGELENTTEDPNNLNAQPDSTSELRIGTNGYESAPIEGAMSDVRIYDRAISDSEVLDLYKQGD